MGINLTEKAMLVTLIRRQWGGDKTDRQVSRELTEEKSAKSRSARVVKHLLPPDALAPIKTASSCARSLHYRYTLPWRDEGPRILRSMIYAEYIAEMRDAMAECRRAEEAFYSGYPVFMARGLAELGDMADENDYPSLDQLKTMFSFSLDVSPIPAGCDFRVDLPDADKIRAQIEADTQQAARDGVKVKLTEAAEIVRHMSERLGSYSPGEDGKRASGAFRDSLVGNIRELATMLPKLNLFEDPKIDEIASEIKKKLSVHDADELRDSEALRGAVKYSADDILDRLEGYIG